MKRLSLEVITIASLLFDVIITSKYDGKDYQGNFNMNLVGQIMERAMLFNLYTFHTPKSTSTAEGINHEIYNNFKRCRS